MSKVSKLRLKVYRKWGQISVKDFEPQNTENLLNYAKNTWCDRIKTYVKVYRDENNDL